MFRNITTRSIHSSRLLLDAPSSAISTNVAQSAPRQGTKIKTKLSWFFAGAALSFGAGYYQLGKDIEAYTSNVEHALEELKRDTLESQQALRNKIADLEN